MNKAFNIPRIMIAAPKSGSGKTLVTCALISALKKRGLDVAGIKTGPDYIDPMFHRSVLGISSDNLDTYFTEDDVTRSLFYEASCGHDISVFEGVMGLFDGMGGSSFTGSAYDLARVCQVPIVLVVDTKGSARSIIPLIQGFIGYDSHHLIRGVILNNMTSHLYNSMKSLLTEEIPVPVLGYFEHNKSLHLESRHLGLVLPGEREDLDCVLDMAAKSIEDTVDIDALLDIARIAVPLEADIDEAKADPFAGENGDLERDRPVIAVARDEAFCFYYQVNLRMLESLGARLKYFSPIHDKGLPEGTNGILLGGGYPELYADKLQANTSMLDSIRKAIGDNVPSLAECGGFMYLHRELIDDKSNTYRLLGLIDGQVSYKGRPVRFGYAGFNDKTGNFLKGDQTIKGHEFHYYDSDCNGSDAVARKPVGDRSWECNIIDRHRWWGFGHLYYPSMPEFAAAFVEKCKAKSLSLEG